MTDVAPLPTKKPPRRTEVSLGWIIGWLALAAVITLSIPVSFLILATKIDTKDEATRCAVVGLVDQLSANSERNTKAALASPSASDEQKTAAATNLARISELKRTTRDTLDHPVGPQCPDV